MIYVLLDGIGDLPHPDLKGSTPLSFAKTPNLDKIARNGSIGQVISVGKGKDGECLSLSQECIGPEHQW